MENAGGISAASGAASAPLQDILAALRGLSARERVSVHDILDAFGEASFLPALVLPALIVVSPLSAIFFLPTVMGLSVALVAVQMLSGRHQLWLPKVLRRQSLAGDTLARATAWLARPAAWLDRQTRQRLTVLFVWPLRLIPLLGCLVSGLMMPFLELVPLSSTVLGVAITLFAVAILVRDGLFVVAGLAVMGVASIIPLVIVQRLT